MYKYYLGDWSSVKLANILSTLKRMTVHLTRIVSGVFTPLELLESLTGKLLKRIEHRPEGEQRKLIEFIFIAHKVFIGMGILFIYFLTSI